jgi:hypothetical protein
MVLGGHGVLVQSLRRRGLRGTLARLIRALQSSRVTRARAAADRAFDARRAVETAAWVRTPDLVAESENRPFAVRYQPSNEDEFHRLMGKLDVDHRDFAFVDYGAGKGKVLLLAAAYPFKRIVGVEFSPPLARIAAQNVATLGADAGRVEMVVADAAEYDPPDEPLVLYFFNPFAANVLGKVLERVDASLARRPRPVYVVLTAPPELAEAVEGAGFAARDVERLGWLTRGVFARGA